MMKVFLDTNVIVDVLENRQPFVTDSANVIGMGILGKIELYTSVLSFMNCLYVARKTIGKENAVEAIRTLREDIQISPMAANEFDLAFANKATDYEDLLQYYSAIAAGCTMIITRNAKHFPKDGLSILSPHEFLTYYC